MPYLEPEEVVSRWTGGDAPDLDDTVLLTLIEDAETLADFKFPTLAQRIENNIIPIRMVKIILSQVVQRAYQNSNNGLTSYSYGAGPFSESGTYGGGVEKKGVLYFTNEEVETLQGKSVGGAFKVNLDIHPASPHINDYPYADYSPYLYVHGEV